MVQVAGMILTLCSESCWQSTGGSWSPFSGFVCVLTCTHKCVSCVCVCVCAYVCVFVLCTCVVYDMCVCMVCVCAYGVNVCVWWKRVR